MTESRDRPHNSRHPSPETGRHSVRQIESDIRVLTRQCTEEIRHNGIGLALDWPTDEAVGFDSAKLITRFLILAEAARRSVIQQDSEKHALQIEDWLCEHSRSPTRELFCLKRSQPRNWIEQIVTPIADRLNGQLNELTPYERLTEIIDKHDRKTRGVYFTPSKLAKTMVDRVDQELAVSFGLVDGLASRQSRESVVADQDVGNNDVDDNRESPFIQILDPAMGCGVFLETCLDRFLERCQTPANIIDFLGRLYGLEICPVATAICHLNILQRLPNEVLIVLSAPLNLFHIDTLCLAELAETYRTDQQAVEESAKTILGTRFSVVIGNPPFGSLTRTTNPAMHRLLHGQSTLEGGDKSYFENATGKLGLKKTWLHDLYVQFFRFAQWQIDKSIAGILSFVSNSNYLDNFSFSGMRYQLMKGFSKIDIMSTEELTGEQANDCFPIATPITVGQFTKRWAGVCSTETNKLANVNRHQEAFVPQPDLFKFVRPRSQTGFQRGILLTDLMPLNSSAIVTARDWLTIGFKRDELVKRISRFADPDIPESEFRNVAKTKTRSSRYKPGDSRGWNLTEARKTIADGDWLPSIVPCWYRAMDQRWIALHETLVDWPRNKVSELLDSNNLALVARRQMVRGRKANYFWVVDAPAIDGIIRSDNRGNESIFPLYRDQDKDQNKDQDKDKEAMGDEWSRSNFDLTNENLRQWVDEGFTPEQVFFIIYAQLWSTQYQNRFADDLLDSFPRLFLPTESGLAKQLASLGKQLVDAHLLRHELLPDPLKVESIELDSVPVWKSDEIFVGGTVIASAIEKQVWAYTVGAHQVARKWLRDRRGRVINQVELEQYAKILGCIKLTLGIAKQIDEIEQNLG